MLFLPSEAAWASPQRARFALCPPQVVRDYLPGDAPPELLGAAASAAPAAPQCEAYTVGGLRLLEAALLLALLGALAAWLYSRLSLPRRRQPHTPAVAEDADAPLVLADFPRFPHPREDGSWPASSNSSFVTKVEAFLRFAGLPYSKRTGEGLPALLACRGQGACCRCGAHAQRGWRGGAPPPLLGGAADSPLSPLAPGCPQASLTPPARPRRSCRTCSAASSALVIRNLSSATWSGQAGGV